MADMGEGVHENIHVYPGGGGSIGLYGCCALRSPSGEAEVTGIVGGLASDDGSQHM